MVLITHDQSRKIFTYMHHHFSDTYIPWGCYIEPVGWRLSGLQALWENRYRTKYKYIRIQNPF